MKPIQVLLADDHVLVRAGFRLLLQMSPDIEVVAEASDGHEVVHLTKIHQPQVVVMDISMPKQNGIEVMTHLATECPDTRVLILSMHTAEEYVLRALRGGAAGYLSKGAMVTDLEPAVRAVANGETYLSPAVAKHVAAYIRNLSGATAAEHSANSDSIMLLSARQREVLQLIAEGRTSREIAALLYISTKTVDAHRAQLMERLHVHGIAGLVRAAVRFGLVSSE